MTLGQRTSLHEAKNCHHQVRSCVCRGLARRGRENRATGLLTAGSAHHLLVTAVQCHKASGDSKVFWNAAFCPCAVWAAFTHQGQS